MATVNDPNEQDPNQQPGSPVAVSGTGGASASGGQGAGVGGAAPQSPVAQNQAAQANTGYTDVGTYLDANRSGSADLGNRVASNLTDVYSKTKGGIDQSAQSVTQAAQKGYTPENSQLIAQVASDPVSAAKNADNASAVQAQLNDQYTGPTDWADFGTQQGNVAQAMQTGALNETPGGLNVLTQTAEGQTGGNQSQGINQLDTLLLGGSPDAMATVKGAADPFKTLNDYINSQNTAVKGSITGAQTAADTARNNATAALLGPTGATTQLNSKVDQETAAARQAAQTQSDQIKAALGTANPTPQDLATIGVTPEQWGALQSQINRAQTARTVSSNQNQFQADTGTTKVDLLPYLSQESADAVINRQNAATADDYARAQALQSLIGSDKFTTDLTDPSQAGKAPTNLNKFDFSGALGDTTGLADAEQIAAQTYVDQLQAGADDAHAQAAAKNAAKNTAYAVALNPTVAGSIGTLGQYNTVKNLLAHPTLKNVLNTPSQVLSNAVNTVHNIFCFHPDTLIEMEDGSMLPICRVDVGDETKGGQVLAIKKAVSSDFYFYRGVVVTGFHAVNEDGKWLRVKDSIYARRIEKFTEVTHNLVTTKHRIWVGGIEFADEHETDQYESLDLNESLEALNRGESVR